MTGRDEILARMKAGGVTPPESAGPLLHRYVEILLTHGKRLLLLSSGDLTEERIAGGHLPDIADGLLLAAPREGAAVIDYGAGGGLVGFAWAVLRPGLAVTLLESKPRKALFLKETAAELGLSNVRVWEGDGRSCARVFPAAFDVAAARGVAAHRKTLSTLHRLLRPGGALLLFKGPESAASAKENAGQVGLSLEREKISLLGDGKRRVFLLLRRRA